MERIKEALKDQNFWLALALIVGGFWTGFSEQDASALISTLFVLIAGVGQFANFFKNAETDVKKWVTNSNFWTYLSVIVIAFVPSLDPQLFSAIQQVATDAINQNWQGVIGGLFTLVTFVYKIITTKKDPDVVVG